MILQYTHCEVRNSFSLKISLNIYCTRAIITRGLYIFYPIFEGQKRFLRSLFIEFCSYVWLVFKSGLKSRAGYNGAHTNDRLMIRKWSAEHGQ